MPLARGEWSIGGVVIEAEPVEWPDSAWKGLELVVSETTGWKTLTTTALASLRTLYNGAHGRVYSGSTGLIVQYLAGTGGPPFTVLDWRGNTGQFVFSPGDGLEVQEVAAEGAVGYYVGRLRMIRVG